MQNTNLLSAEGKEREGYIVSSGLMDMHYCIRNRESIRTYYTAQ